MIVTNFKQSTKYKRYFLAPCAFRRSVVKPELIRQSKADDNYIT